MEQEESCSKKQKTIQGNEVQASRNNKIRAQDNEELQMMPINNEAQQMKCSNSEGLQKKT